GVPKADTNAAKPESAPGHVVRQAEPLKDDPAPQAAVQPSSPELPAAAVNAVMRVTCAGPGFVAIRADAWQAIAQQFGEDEPFQAG
ncbi:hypothetical protein, partial [Mesorhizobium sp. M2D.F.Ca.ET.140.01.1.1]|uniref:hypothetical protein n=1 Tax=Mesorhizobium sp. M2D.F.Ca.ET.140.01.1.1 TaxID=2496664 RepID=UPI0016736DB4